MPITPVIEGLQRWDAVPGVVGVYKAILANEQQESQPP